jgi:hypothetical protein
MTGKAMNWNRVKTRHRMWMNGVESTRDDSFLVSPLLKNYPRGQRPKPVSKAELRAQSEQAVAEWSARRKVT